MKLEVGTFNIRLGIQQGLRAIADVVQPYDLDILAVQEIGDRWTMGPEGHSTVELARMLGMTGKFIPAIEEAGARYGTAFFTTLPIIDFSIMKLPEEYDEPRRMARIELDADGPVIVFCTHLSHVEDRELQWDTVLDTVLEQITNDEYPVMLLGDLNETPDHWAIQELKKAMIDADPEDHPTFPSTEPERRIDYIFASHDLSRAVIDENADASDHRLVTTTWSF